MENTNIGLWSKVPKFIQAKIFSELSPKELGRMERVAKYFLSSEAIHLAWKTQCESLGFDTNIDSNRNIAWKNLYHNMTNKNNTIKITENINI